MRLFFKNHVDGKTQVKIDRIQFGRVLSNLVDNSVKYKKESEGRIEITLGNRQDEIQIQFSDDGKGIRDDEADKIFESFYRADLSQSSSVKGNGLGLAITKQKEFDLFVFLAQNPNIVFSKDTLFDRIWGLDSLADTSTVTVHINRIREKIEADTANPKYIETVWGAGYRFHN